MGRRHRGGGVLRVGNAVLKMPRLSRKEMTLRQKNLIRTNSFKQARERGEAWW